MISKKLLATGALVVGLVSLSAAPASAGPPKSSETKAKSVVTAADCVKDGKLSVKVLKDFDGVVLNPGEIEGTKAIAGKVVTVEFEAARPECIGTFVGLASYKAVNNKPGKNGGGWEADVAKQILHASAKPVELQEMDKKYSLEVEMPNGCYQADLFVGELLTKLGPAGSDNFYKNRLVSAVNGYEGCVDSTTAPSETTVPQSTTTTTKAETAVAGAETTTTSTSTSTTAAAVNPSGDKVLGAPVQAVNSPASTSHTNSPTGVLARTGLDVVQMLATGLGILGLGFLVRMMGISVRKESA